MNVEIIPLARKDDARGAFLKILMRHQIQGAKVFGEIYVATCRPGETRGGHYHCEATEWFCVIQGQGELELMDIVTGERRVIRMDGHAPATVVVPPRVAHALRNAGAEPLWLLAYSDQPYDAERPDTVPAAM